MKRKISNYEIRITRYKVIAACIGAFFILMGHAVCPEKSAADDADATVSMIQEKFAKIKGLKGAFTQISYIKDLEEKHNYAGSFYIKKPARMMWEYSKPRDEKVVMREMDTWIYKKTENQVIKTTFSKEAYSQVPIALLESFENIKNDFEVTMPEKNALNLVPKRKIGFIQMIVLEVREGDFPIKMFTIFDTYGNIIMVELGKVKINPGLDDALFVFEIPPGAEVYDMNQQ